MQKIFPVLLFAAACLGTPTWAQGTSASAVPVLTGFEAFAQLTGIEGESAQSDHPRWIDVLGYSFGVSQAAATSAGGASAAGKPSFEELKILKHVDKSTPVLFSDTVRGMRIPAATVDIGRTVNGRFEHILVYTLSNAFITSVKPAGSSEGKLLEEVALRFARIQISYYQYGPDGTAMKPIEATLDAMSRI